jgi:hypothetical protein
MVNVSSLVALLSPVILFRSQEHPSCPPLPGCVRAHLESKLVFLCTAPAFLKVSGTRYFIGWNLLGSHTYYDGIEVLVKSVLCHVTMPEFMYMRMRHEELEFILNWGSHAVRTCSLAL